MKHKYTLYFRFMQFEGIGFFVFEGKGLISFFADG